MDNIQMPKAAPEIRLRPLRPKDVSGISQFIPDRLIAPDGSSIAFDRLAACEALLAEGGMSGIVVTAGHGSDDRIVGVGAAAFVTDDFLRSQRTGRRPGLPERVLYSAFKPDSPVLRKPAICRENERRGLNLVVVIHQHDKVGEELERETRMHLTKAFLDDFRGYRLREILTEVLGEEELRWAFSGGGFVLRDSYDEWYRTRTEPSPRRYLVGVTREEALASEGSVLSLLFHYHDPVCGFTSAERRLLQAAVKGSTDAEISSALGISMSAVKKRWTAIFERTESTVSDLAPASPVDRRGDLARGPQKRHKIIAYLREHPEEVRP
jgi:hypothetical protein